MKLILIKYCITVMRIWENVTTIQKMVLKNKVNFLYAKYPFFKPSTGVNGS